MEIDLDSVRISCSTIFRARVQHRKVHFNELVNSSNSFPDYLVLHFDGIRLKYNQNFIHKLVMVVSGENFEQLLNVTSTENSKAVTIATELLKQLEIWQLISKVKFLSCDLTNVNSGIFNGAIVQLEELIYAKHKIKKSFVILYCRHHMYEIFFSKIVKLYFASDGPILPIITNFQKKFNSLDKSSISCFEDSNDIFSENEKLELLSFLNKQLELNQSRSDYKTLIYLCKLFLFREEKPKICYPGAATNSRFMKQIIYFFYIYLFRKDPAIIKSSFNIETLEIICIFVLKCYIRPWMQCSKAAYAPFDDLKFYKDVLKFSSLNKQISDIVIDSMDKHLYYLEDLVFLVFCDDRLDNEIKKNMVLSLVKDYEDVLLNDQTTLDQLFSNETNDKLYDLLGSEVLRFINENVENWEENERFKIFLNIVNSLNVTNDTSEKAVGIAKDFKDMSVNPQNNLHIHTASTDRQTRSSFDKITYNK